VTGEPAVRNDRSRLDSLRAWLLSDPVATWHAEDVQWAVDELSRLRPELCIAGASRVLTTWPTATDVCGTTSVSMNGVL
jgi:hypothetical protein